MVTEIKVGNGEANYLRDLLLVQQRATRDVEVAFTMCVRANGIPDTAILKSVSDDSITVELPSVEAVSR